VHEFHFIREDFFYFYVFFHFNTLPHCVIVKGEFCNVMYLLLSIFTLVNMVNNIIELHIFVLFPYLPHPGPPSTNKKKVYEKDTITIILH